MDLIASKQLDFRHPSMLQLVPCCPLCDDVDLLDTCMEPEVPSSTRLCRAQDQLIQAIVVPDLEPDHHRADDVIPDDDPLLPLLALDMSQLIALTPPLVIDPETLACMREHKASLASYLKLTMKKGSAWTDVEHVWHMTCLVNAANQPGLTFLDPLLAYGWMASSCCVLDHMAQWISNSSFPTCILSVVHCFGHWIPVVWRVRGNVLDVHVWDHDRSNITVLQPLHHRFCQALKLSCYQVTCTRRSFGRDHCGAAAFAFLRYHCLAMDMPNSQVELEDLHVQCRLSFAATFLSTKVDKPWCYGTGPPETQNTLATLLQFHGVPPALSQTRAKLLMQSLGKDQVSQALQGIPPWKSLKALANQQGPKLQLVLPDEQAQLAAKRTPQDNRSSKKQKKGISLPQQPSKPVDLDVSKLSLDSGVFRVDQDVAVSQIPLSAVGPLASGVALATFQDAQPFIKTDACLTQRGLALLIVGHTEVLPCHLSSATVRVAVRCTLNQEPMLVTGTLLQLGQSIVYQYTPKLGSPLPSIAVACARFSVYADQWPDDWEVFQTKPVKQVFDRVPVLQTCRQPDCTCIKWHSTDPSVPTEAVLDVFRRQFFAESGRPTSGDRASHITVSWFDTSRPWSLRSLVLVVPMGSTLNPRRKMLPNLALTTK